MKTAIDLKHKGGIVEVDADSFPFAIKGQTRFICPECGEPVVMVDKLNKYFRHLNQKNAKVKECERRVESYITKSITERLGIPLYLRKDGEMYTISIGFRPIPDGEIEKGVKNSWFIKVRDGSRSEPVYRINYINFNDFAYKYIPVTSVISNIIKIEYSNEECERSLKKYWSDKCELLNTKEMIFKDGTDGGKRILPGESIITHTSYYWVKDSDRMTSSFEGINFKKVSEIKLTNKTYYVYHGSFDIDTGHGIKYDNLANYIRQQLGVYLSDKISFITPLWPPCIKTSEGYSYTNTTDSYFYIHTNNDCPKIYNFIADFPVPKEETINTNESGKIYYTKINHLGNMINVDRKFVSGTFLNVAPIIKKFNYDLFESDLESEEVSLDDFRHSEMNIRGDLDFYFLNNSFNITKQKISAKEDIIYPKEVAVIYVVSNECILKRFIIKKTSKNNLSIFNDNDLYTILRKHQNDYLVNANSFVLKEINILIKNCPKSKVILNKFRETKKVPLFLYELLKRRM